ncbi:MAG: hypothetical protein ACI4IF_01515 [Acutalibacteraceae bacterium]
MKNTVIKGKKILLTAALLTFVLFLFIKYPQAIGNGVKEGLTLLGTTLIPSLFPFMVVSSFISNNNTVEMLLQKTDSFSKRVFKTSGKGVLAFLLGILGGYPVGAKTIAENYKQNRITQNEAERLFYWCITPSFSFAVTAVGTFMLNSTALGVIVYISCILSSLTIAILCRFLSNDTYALSTQNHTSQDNAQLLVDSVKNGIDGMLGISGWVLLFSGFSGAVSSFNIPQEAKLFIQSVLEVTKGSEIIVKNSLSLPVLSAAVGFSGFAVICQITAYGKQCNISVKKLLVSRVLNAVFSSIYTYIICNIFSISTSVSVTLLNSSSGTISLYHSFPAAVILLIMCGVFILEVETPKKVC